MMDMAAMTVNDTELRIKGIEALNRDLGPVLALRFLSLLHREPTDYVDVSRRLYAGQSIDGFSIGRRSSGADDPSVDLHSRANGLTMLVPRTQVA